MVVQKEKKDIVAVSQGKRLEGVKDKLRQEEGDSAWGCMTHHRNGQNGQLSEISHLME